MDLGAAGGQQGPGGNPYANSAYHQMRSPFSTQAEHQNDSAAFGARMPAGYPFYQNVHLTSNPLGPYASGAGASFLSYQSPGSPREGIVIVIILLITSQHLFLCTDNISTSLLMY